jgi:hypothetical protein
MIDGVAAFAEALHQIGRGFAIVFDDEELHWVLLTGAKPVSIRGNLDQIVNAFLTAGQRIS